MLAYLALLPHATSLHALITGSHNQIPASVTTAFDRIASDIHQRGIKTILVLASHPRYTRQGFSAYVDTQYNLHFKDFGNLTHQEPMDISWDLFQRVRESGSTKGIVLHPISDPEPDFAHALPLWLISRQWPVEFKTRVLCVNDYVAATPQERIDFGSLLGHVCEELDEPIAVIVSHECVFAESLDSAALNRVKEANMQFRYQAGSIWTTPQTEPTHIAQPCSQGVFQITKALLGSKQWAYEELCFEHVANTSILISRLLPPPT